MVMSKAQFAVEFSARYLIGIACLMAGMMATQPTAAQMSAEVTIGDRLPSPDGRLHLTILGVVDMAGSVIVEEVHLNGEVLEIVLMYFPGVSPVVGSFGFSMVVDSIPPGEYSGVVLSGIFDDLEDLLHVGEFAFEVADPLRQRVPMPVRFWPDSPTIFDELWLLVEPVQTCSVLELIFDISSIVLDETSAACAENESPRTLAFPVGRMEERSITALVRYWINGERVNQTDLRLEVRDVLTSRLTGSWYNPDESGHGLNLEVLDDETLLAYWYTFDPSGERFWLIAMGAHQGGGRVVLDALMVEGGAFPPAFDPALIDLIDWGTLEIEFASCTEATLRWMPEAAGFEAGEMPLVRLSGAADHNCVDPPPESVLVPDWFKNADFYFLLGD